jgi:hypothetical protein
LGFSIINHPAIGVPPFLETSIYSIYISETFHAYRSESPHRNRMGSFNILKDTKVAISPKMIRKLGHFGSELLTFCWKSMGQRDPLLLLRHQRGESCNAIWRYLTSWFAMGMFGMFAICVCPEILRKLQKPKIQSLKFPMKTYENYNFEVLPHWQSHFWHVFFRNGHPFLPGMSGIPAAQTMIIPME